MPSLSWLVGSSSREGLKRPVSAVGAIVVMGLLLRVVLTESGNGAPPESPVGLGGEVVFVFMASSTCQNINDPALKPALDEARTRVQEFAERSGRRFVTSGIALDIDIDAGTRLLDRFGPFDEIHVGRSWVNTAAANYWHPTGHLLSVIPQLLITDREIIGEYGMLRIRDERVIARRLGASNIIAWNGP